MKIRSRTPEFLGGGSWFSPHPLTENLFRDTRFLRQAVAITALTGTGRLRNVKRSNSELETDTKETKSTNI